MKQARVIYHRAPESMWAESPDAPGWTAAATTLAELTNLVREGLEFTLGEPVNVIELVETRPATGAGLGIPVQILSSTTEVLFATTWRDVNEPTRVRAPLIPVAG